MFFFLWLFPPTSLHRKVKRLDSMPSASEPGGLLGSGIMKIKVQMKFGAWAQSWFGPRGRCSTGRLSMAKSPEATTRSSSNALVPLFGGRGKPLLKWTERKKLVPTSSDSGGPEALVSVCRTFGLPHEDHRLGEPRGSAAGHPLRHPLRVPGVQAEGHRRHPAERSSALLAQLCWVGKRNPLQKVDKNEKKKKQKRVPTYSNLSGGPRKSMASMGSWVQDLTSMPPAL